jgi:hypothetical protein
MFGAFILREVELSSPVVVIRTVVAVGAVVVELKHLRNRFLKRITWTADFGDRDQSDRGIVITPIGGS